MDQFKRLKSQQNRYFIEENPTIKCFNCHQYGHKSFDCPNQRKAETCLLCAKEGHSSFDCYEKLCFKCNKAGHEIRDCVSTSDLQKCSKCGMLGHKEQRCLKEWRNDKLGDGLMKVSKCIQCGKNGHLKCTREKTTFKMDIEFRAPDNFNALQDISDDDEFVNAFIQQDAQVFVHKAKSKKDRKKEVKQANVVIKLGRNDEGYYSSDFETPLQHNSDDIYCPSCA